MRRRGSVREKRAAELFVIDEWGSDSGFVEKAWRTHSVPEPLFMSIAASHWQIVVTTQRDLTQVTVRGPETKATVTAIPTEAEFFGIVFSLGTFMPTSPLARLVDRAVTLPAATPSSVWLDSSPWEIPTPGNADVFVDRLVREGLVVRDPVVAESLQGDVDGISTRTLQRRVARATPRPTTASSLPATSGSSTTRRKQRCRHGRSQHRGHPLHLAAAVEIRLPAPTSS